MCLTRAHTLLEPASSPAGAARGDPAGKPWVNVATRKKQRLGRAGFPREHGAGSEPQAPSWVPEGDAGLVHFGTCNALPRFWPKLSGGKYLSL